MEETVLINGTSFVLHDYYHTNDNLSIVVRNTTIAAIEEAIGGSEATVQIGSEYKGFNLAVSNISKVYNQQFPGLYSVNFHAAILEQKIDQNSADIEIANGAIAELAEIIGGGE